MSPLMLNVPRHPTITCPTAHNSKCDIKCHTQANSNAKEWKEKGNQIWQDQTWKFGPAGFRLATILTKRHDMTYMNKEERFQVTLMKFKLNYFLYHLYSTIHSNFIQKEFPTTRYLDCFCLSRNHDLEEDLRADEMNDSCLVFCSSCY